MRSMSFGFGGTNQAARNLFQLWSDPAAAILRLQSLRENIPSSHAFCRQEFA